ncbi:MAG TPA: UbiA family prenyltransferase [Candidatus Thermoplasmatota archaeon]|nr:UbiA family prenyltransferase [Candidatus Thermoplasmatota archaeon]
MPAAAILQLLRPRQWYKNLVVLVPLLFSGNVGNPQLWPPALLAFAAFCLLSSAAYAANDAVDAPRDRLHARKRERPVASGRIPAPLAWAIAASGAAAGLAVLALMDFVALALGAAFLALQGAYNLALKHVLIWDALTLAAGFVLRALAGTAALAIGDPTAWLILCTFLFALYLALAKRRHELLLPDAGAHRPVLQSYTRAFLEQTMQVATTLLLASYALYTFFGTTRWMMFTLPFAFYGILRHNWLVHTSQEPDEASLLLRDRPTIANVLAWAAVVALVLAGYPQRLHGWLGGLA